MRAEFRLGRIVLEKGRQQIRMPRRHAPEQRQHALVGQERFPRRFEKLRRDDGRRAAIFVVPHPFPRIELEHQLDRAVLHVDEARFGRDADVGHGEALRRKPRLLRAIVEIGDETVVLACARHDGEIEATAASEFSQSGDQFFVQAVELVGFARHAPGGDLVFKPDPLENSRLIERSRRVGVVFQQFRRPFAIVGKVETAIKRRVAPLPAGADRIPRMFGDLQQAQGLFLTLQDRGRVAEVLSNWHYDDVRIIVVTDGERILGLGDLGANGMGIPVGKLSLYVGCAGVHPAQCLPITLDTGTNNPKLLNDPLYIGLPHERVRGEAYDALVEEFIQAVQQVFPRAIVQFEDFGNSNAFRLLHQYRDRICTFDDDIQGTASVVLAGLYASQRLTDLPLNKHTFLFYGAGEAGIGIGDLIVAAMMEEGLSEAEARQRCWFFDSKGLVVAERTDLVAHKRPYAHKHPFVGDFLTAVETLKPTGIIGVAGAGKAFTQPIIETMARLNGHPIIFALSNPTSKSECTAQEAYGGSEGRAIFASGSPFPPLEYQGRRIVPGQGNNSYIFPGVGLGVILSGARRIPDEMFMAAAKALAAQVTDSDLALSRIYPALERIREVSAVIAAATAQVAYDHNLATLPKPADLVSAAQAAMYEPKYVPYV